MNKIYLWLAATLLATTNCGHSSAQERVLQQATAQAPAGNAAWTSNGQLQVAARQLPHPAAKTNFTTLTGLHRNTSAEVAASNKGYENDAELGLLFAGAPCADCYELLDKRTETQKYFVKEGSDGRQFIVHSSSQPQHYLDGQGRWKTISDRLEATPNGHAYTTKGRPVNIEVNTQAGYTSLTGTNGKLTYNNGLELVHVLPDGTEQSLGKAKWTNFTVGDDGMRIADAWPGIDAEIRILVNSVKTSFVVKHAMPAYAGGKLVIRDHMFTGKGVKADHQEQHYTGALALKDADGRTQFTIQKAVVYQQNNQEATTQDIAYTLDAGGTLDMEVPGSLLNGTADAYPLVIDPLVSGTVSTGFTYGYSVFCDNVNNVAIPAAATLSDIRITYNYYGIAGAPWLDAGYYIEVSTACATTIWGCTGTASGIPGTTCGITNASFWSPSSGYADWGTAGSCLPAFSCSAYTLPFTLHANQYYLDHGACEQSVYATANGFTVDVYGSTSPVSISPAGPNSICVAGTDTLIGIPSGGSWTSSDGSVASVDASGVVTGLATGTVNITYTSGLCTAVRAIAVDVPLTVPAIAGPATSVCQASTLTLSDTMAGGVWSSAAPGIAAVSTVGHVTGVAAGAALISYTVTNACGAYAATQSVTVNALPDTGLITGSAAICFTDSNTTTLSDATGGGSWSSGAPAVATVNASGVVHALTIGAATISYTVSNTFCTASATRVVHVSTAPASVLITGPSSICAGNFTTLTEPAPGGSWHSSNTAAATVNNAGMITGIAGGTAVISYTLVNACGTYSDTAGLTVFPAYSAGEITTIAGDGTSGYIGDGGLALYAEIAVASDIVADAAGNKYFINDNRVRKINAAGIITTIAGTGAYGFDGDGGPASAASFRYPMGIALDAAGNIYIADNNNNRIRKIDAAGIINTVAGSGLGGWYLGDGGPATAAPISQPTSLAFDAAGNLYIAEPEFHTIRKVDVSSGIITAFAQQSFWNPYAIFIDGTGTMYATDADYHNVKKINTTGGISLLAGGSTSGYSGDGGPATDARMYIPYGVCTDSSGNVYIAEYGNNCIRKVNTAGIISTMAGIGSPGYSGDGGLPQNAALHGPNSITADAANNLYLVDALNNRIRKISTAPAIIPAITGADSMCTGTTTTLANSLAGGTWQSSDTAVATVSATGVVTALTVGSVTLTYTMNNVCGAGFVTRTLQVRTTPTVTGIYPISTSALCQYSSIQLIDYTPGGVWSSSATGVAAAGNNLYDPETGTVSGVSQGTATISYTLTNWCGSASATYPVTVTPTYAATDIIYTFAGWYDMPTVIPNGGDGGPAVYAYVPNPQALSLDGAGNMYIADYYAVRKINTAGIITTIAGNGTNVFSGDNGPATAAGIAQANDLAADAAGNVYIADLGANTIRKVSASTGIITNFAGTSTPGFSGDGGPATAASFNGPLNVVADAAGNIYVSDGNNYRIRKISTAGIITTVAGNGISAYAGDGLAATATAMNPTSVTMDAAGNMYVSDYMNGRVRKINTAGIVSTYAGNGSAGIAGMGGPATAASIGAPGGLYIDPAGNLFISCPQNNMVLKVNTSGIISIFAGTGWGAFAGDGGPAPAANLLQNNDVIGDGAGNIFIADLGNHKVRLVSHYNTIVPAITGNDTLCAGITSPLSNSLTGGTWSSSLPGIASITAGGNVSAVSAGSAVITYTLSNSCGTAAVYDTVTVKALPNAGTISGPSSILCLDSTVTFTNTTTGGTWSTATGAMSITTGGVATGVSTGIDTVKYTVTNDCGAAVATRVITVTVCPDGVPVMTRNSTMLKVYPNPNSTGVFTIYIPSASGADAHMTVTNILGEKIQETTLHTNAEHELVFSGPAGIYFINVVTNEQHQTVKVVLTN